MKLMVIQDVGKSFVIFRRGKEKMSAVSEFSNIVYFWWFSSQWFYWNLLELLLNGNWLWNSVESIDWMLFVFMWCFEILILLCWNWTWICCRIVSETSSDQIFLWKILFWFAMKLGFHVLSCIVSVLLWNFWLISWFWWTNWKILAI